MDIEKERLHAVGKQIALLRKARGMTQKELSEAADCSRMFISHFENGEMNASLLTIFALCKALDVSVDIVFTPS